LWPIFVTYKMKETSFKISLTFISIAVLGLILIQFYWIDNAIKIKEREFKRTISQVLLDVVDEVEKAEALSKLKSHHQGKFLFFNTDSISDNVIVPDTGFDVMMVREVRKKNNEIEINIVESKNGEQTTKKIVKSIGNGSGDSLMELVNEEIELRLGEFEEINKSIENVSIDVDSIFKKRVRHKTAVIGDIVKSLIEIDIYETIEERLSKTDLLEKLRLKFIERGIDSEMYFGVFNDQDNIVLSNLKEGVVAEVLKESAFSVQLFPNDVIGKTNSLKVYFPNKTSFVLAQMWSVMLLSIIIMVVIIVGFTYTFLTILKQKKVSEIKNDFINNITHELKTPISTISLACQTLSDDSIVKEKSLVDRYVKMIGDENKRLGTLVENVLQSAIFDKAEFELKKESVGLNYLVSKAVKNIRLQVERKEGSLSFKELDKDIELDIDQIHFVNILTNLLDNANKYSNEKPQIIVSIIADEYLICVDIQDNGIGISKEHQKKIFEKLYRVPTGNLHNTKGFGLGLSYVKTVVEKHGWNISVVSKENRGSTFTINIPRSNDN
jgi:two-component system phosphate regulon sensor histidine kinase PhoR